MISSPSSPIRVMLVDDHTMVRRGLAIFLKVFDDLQLAGEAESGEAAIELCGEVLPDVILMDMVLPMMDGAKATRAIRQKFPQVQIIALTSFKDGKLIMDALEAGAIGYLLKDVSADELAEAIRAAHSGRATLSPEVAQVLVRTANQPPAPGLDLTERERVVLALMIEGLNNTQIAGKLSVSPSTIKSHVSNILSKLRCRQPHRSSDACAAKPHRLLRFWLSPKWPRYKLPCQWMRQGSICTMLNSMTRVYLADAKPGERSALRLLLLDLNMEVAGEADNWSTTLAQAPINQIDMLVVDWDLLPNAPTEALGELRKACPAALVIVLISHLDARQQAAISAGADAFISKGEMPDRVAERLRLMAASIRA